MIRITVETSKEKLVDLRKTKEEASIDAIKPKHWVILVKGSPTAKKSTVQ